VSKKELQETEREVTRAEKVLAVALAVFLLVGGLRIAWAINDFFPHPDYLEIQRQFISESLAQEMGALWQQQNGKQAALQRLQEEESVLRLQYETAREEYRTLLDRGIDDAGKKAQWEQARSRMEQAQLAISAAEKAQHDFRTTILEPKEKVFRGAEERFQARLVQLMRQRNLRAGLGLMAYALLGFALSIWVFNVFRSKPFLSRYAVIGTSFLGFGVLQMLVVSFQVAHPFLQGVIPVEWIVSLGGSGISVAGIIFLKRKYLSTEAVRSRRLWKKACPICGFPKPGNCCNWCGVAQTTPCASCGLPTNSFSPYCQECGGKQAHGAG